MHLIQPGVTYSGCGPFTKKKKIHIQRNRKFKIYLSKRTR